MTESPLPDAFSVLDLRFARFMAQMSGSPDERLILAAALLSRSVRTGDVCLEIGAWAGKALPEHAAGFSSAVCPPLTSWVSALRSSSVVAEPGQKRPLVLDGRNRLYLYRYWEYEEALAGSIRERVGLSVSAPDMNRLQQAIQSVFRPVEGRDDGQRMAAAVAALQRLCVITGGPGTGKTFTIARILAVLAEQSGGQPLRSLLAAPTGKAAARLRDALHAACGGSGIGRPAAKTPPADVFTVHRLLKPISGSPDFRHNRFNPLPAEVVIVDEASMVDLALMAKLMDAVAPSARIILVGDKDQLASVEAGSVLGNICDRNRPHGVSAEMSEAVYRVAGVRLPLGGLKPDLRDCIVELQKSYRFAAGSSIAELSRAVNQGDAQRALGILSAASGTPVTWLDPETRGDIGARLEERILAGYRSCFQDPTPQAALQALHRFKILCAHKAGPLGVEALNRTAERVLSRQGLIRPGVGGDPRWYMYRPVLITRNDYPLDLFNGDIGIALPDPASSPTGPVFVFFQAAAGGIRRFLPYRLPEHETAYAMTVHKSQGSEFDDILLVLPDRDSPILTRELIYTALTRSRRTITIWGRRSILTACINRRIERASGLRDALWGSD